MLNFHAHETPLLVVGPLMVNPYDGKLADDERATLARLVDVLETFRLLDRRMPVHLVIAFLQVAQNEGMSILELAKRTGASQSTMSRHLLEIGSERRAAGEGLGLVRHDKSPEDLKRAEMRLTEKGAHLARRVVRMLRGVQS